MSLEIERRFYTFDRKILEEKIKEIGGIRKGMYNFQSLGFEPPKGYYVFRLRDEQHRITFTLKEFNKENKYATEDEVIVSDFNKMKIMLEKLGHKKKYFKQKIREIYNIGETELVFDHYPGIPGFIEIESPTEKELFEVADKLNLIKDEPGKGMNDLYYDLYGIPKDKLIYDLAFDTVYETYKKYIVKNEDLMIKILEGQKKLMEKITK